MFRTAISLLLLIMLIPGQGWSQRQSRIDSLVNLLEGATDEEKVEIFCQVSELYWQHSFDTSLLMAIHAHNIAGKLDNPALTATSLYMIGNAYYLIGDYPNSMDYYLQALVLREELGDSSNIAGSYNNIGAVYLHMNDERKALEYFKRSGIIFRAMGDDHRLFPILNNIGAVYIDFDKLDTAYQYFTQAYEIAERSGDEINLSIVLTNLGETAYAMGLYSQSENYQQRAYKISQKLGDKGMMSTIRSNIGKLHLERKEYPQALEAFKESLLLSREIHSLPNIQENFKNLSEYYSLTGDYKMALRFNKLYSAAKDSIMSQEGIMQIRELELKFSARNLQQEIEMLRLENEIQSLKQTRMKYGIVSLAVVMFALILMFVSYYQRNRFKKETTRLLEDKNRQMEKANKKLQESEKHLIELNSTKDKFFSIIGHDLRNPLNALLGFSELISGNSREYSPEEVQKYGKIINEAAKNIHLLIENLLEWSRSQSGNIEYHPQETDLSPVIEEIVKIAGIQAEKKTISIESGIPAGTSVFADRNLLSTILRNLTDNAVKFTGMNGKVRIYSRQTEEGVCISVTDNGVGMTETQIDTLFSLIHGPASQGTEDETGTGLGLILCKEFVAMHGGRIWAKSKPKQGSTFSFILPNKK